MYIIQILFSIFSLLNISADTSIQEEPPINQQPVVFIAGFDEGDNLYYTQAKKYFTDQQYTVIEHKYSLTEIVDWLNEQSPSTTPKEVHIVSHSNPWRGLSMKATPNGERILLKI